MSTEAMYLRDVGKIPILSPERERELSQRILGQNDDSARQELITGHLRFAIREARKVWLQFGDRNKISFMDLVQSANMGLIQAARKFDSRRANFQTYAEFWVRGETYKALVESGFILLPRHLYENLATIHQASRKLADELKRPPTLEELSAATELPIKTLKNTLKFLNLSVTSLDEPLDDEDSGTLGDVTPDTGALNAEQINLARKELRAAKGRVSEIFTKVSEMCTPAQIKAFLLLYGEENDSKIKTFKEAAQEPGVSYQDIQQKINAVWKKIGYTDKVAHRKGPLTSERNRIKILEKILESVDSTTAASKDNIV